MGKSNGAVGWQKKNFDVCHRDMLSFGFRLQAHQYQFCRNVSGDAGGLDSYILLKQIQVKMLRSVRGRSSGPLSLPRQQQPGVSAWVLKWGQRGDPGRKSR